MRILLQWSYEHSHQIKIHSSTTRIKYFIRKQINAFTSLNGILDLDIHSFFSLNHWWELDGKVGKKANKKEIFKWKLIGFCLRVKTIFDGKSWKVLDMTNQIIFFFHLLIRTSFHYFCRYRKSLSLRFRQEKQIHHMTFVFLGFLFHSNDK